MQNAAASAGEMLAKFNMAQSSVSGFIQTARGLYPALSGLADSIPQMAMTLKSTVTADSSQILRARAAGLAEYRIQNMDLRDGIQKLINVTQDTGNKMVGTANSDIVVRIGDEAVARAARRAVESAVRYA